MKILDQDEFWEKSCDVRFYRIDRNRGAIGADTFICFNPPDAVFMAKKMAEIKGFLTPQPLLPSLCRSLVELAHRLYKKIV